jgi:hypothetical protein
MIHDKRELTLTNPALAAVIKLGQTLPGFGFPPGDLRAVKPQVDGGCMVEIERLGGGLHEFTVPPENVAAAFIAYARKHRIPLPKRAQKQLAEANGNIIIMMTLDIETESRTF